MMATLLHTRKGTAREAPQHQLQQAIAESNCGELKKSLMYGLRHGEVAAPSWLLSICQAG